MGRKADEGTAGPPDDAIAFNAAKGGDAAAGRGLHTAVPDERRLGVASAYGGANELAACGRVCGGGDALSGFTAVRCEK